MRKIIALLVGMMLCAFIVPTMAQDSDTITVTLTPGATADVYVNQTAWDPSCGIGGTEQTAADWGLVQNNGTVAVDVDVKASDTASWTVEAAAGHNQFQLNILGDNAIALSDTDQTWEDPLEANGQAGYQETFGLNVTMPTSSSTNVAQVSTITFTSTIK